MKIKARFQTTIDQLELDQKVSKVKFKSNKYGGFNYYEIQFLKEDGTEISSI